MFVKKNVCENFTEYHIIEVNIYNGIYSYKWITYNGKYQGLAFP